MAFAGQSQPAYTGKFNWYIMNFKKVRETAGRLEFLAGRIWAHAGDKTPGLRMCYPTEEWTKSGVRECVWQALMLVRDSGMDPTALFNEWVELDKRITESAQAQAVVKILLDLADK